MAPCPPQARACSARRCSRGHSRRCTPGRGPVLERALGRTRSAPLGPPSDRDRLRPGAARRRRRHAGLAGRSPSSASTHRGADVVRSSWRVRHRLRFDPAGRTRRDCASRSTTSSSPRSAGTTRSGSGPGSARRSARGVSCSRRVLRSSRLLRLSRLLDRSHADDQLEVRVAEVELRPAAARRRPGGAGTPSCERRCRRTRPSRPRRRSLGEQSLADRDVNRQKSPQRLASGRHSGLIPGIVTSTTPPG